jgi:deazaflavin-dependent oxidoreductase (nitroreductase family)
MRVVKNTGPPTGVRRFLFRLPVQLYRLHLGWLLGQRILLLHHIGRVTGKRRSVVLEVVEHDDATDAFTVASGWGPKAAWYRNILDHPAVTVDVGRRTMAVTALPLSRDEGAELFVRYAARHPKAARRILPRLMGYAVDGSEQDFREVGRRLPFVRLERRV